VVTSLLEKNGGKESEDRYVACLLKHMKNEEKVNKLREKPRIISGEGEGRHMRMFCMVVSNQAARMKTIVLY